MTFSNKERYKLEKIMLKIVAFSKFAFTDVVRSRICLVLPCMEIAHDRGFRHAGYFGETLMKYGIFIPDKMAC